MATNAKWVFPTLLVAALLLMLALPTVASEPTGEPYSQTLQSQTQGQPTPGSQAIVYHGNVKSKKFHAPGCRYYNCKNCRAVFKSRRAAIAAGYVPCKVCRP